LRNTILPDGSLTPLALAANEQFWIRNDQLIIHVSQATTFDPASTLAMFFDNDPWGSTIVIAGISPRLAGSLRLGFAPGTDLTSLVGRTFHLFDWNGTLDPSEYFDQIVSRPCDVWDLSQLYTAGTVTLVSMPEPATLLGAGMGAALCALGFFLRNRSLRTRAGS
jgi:hypothetical protein